MQRAPLHGLRAPPVAGLVIVALSLAAALVPGSTLAGDAPHTPLAADIPLLVEDFEGGFPGAWNVGDANPGNGTDTWATGGYRSFNGTRSAWSAGQGTQTLNWTGSGPADGRPFSDGLENVTLAPTWNASDADPTDGDDFWNLTSIRRHNGTQSMWCAQDGNNSVAGDLNSVVYQYDNSMDSLVWRTVNLTSLAGINASTATLEYYYFTDTELSVDFLLVDYYDGVQWNSLVSYSGDSGGWQIGTVDVPAAATAIGFRFTSDSGGTLEGAYVDDVRLYASHDEPNVALRTYDVSMNSNMTIGVDLSLYTSGNLSYHYWLDAESPNDTLSAAYFAGGAWTYLDTRTGSSGGWQTSAVTIPKNATRIGFRFIADAQGHKEGAYLDDIRLVGHVLDLICSASVSQPTGFEALTPFNYTATASQGLPPYGWSWNFSDGGAGVQQNVSRIFTNVGTYTANFTVRDAAGQSCTAVAPPVTVAHDTTVVSVSPFNQDVTEGDTLAISGFDHRGHALVLNWTLSSASCGVLSAGSGTTVNFTASVDAGGMLCIVRGSFGSVNATSNLTILHDLSEILITPPAASVVEGEAVAFSATDAKGHALDFAWAVSVGCGNLTVRIGPATVLNATGQGGTECRLAVSLSGHVGVANVTILHDTSLVTLFPTAGQLVEGTSMDLRTLDRYAHAVEAAWSLTPSTCGALSNALGNDTSFTASTEAGGSNCTVTALVNGTVVLLAHIAILHDISAVTLNAGASVLIEGESAAFSLVDTYGHPYVGSWSVTPTSCGAFSSPQGGSVTFTSSTSAGGVNCTVNAAVGINAWHANVTVLHGPPATVVIAQGVNTVVEGGSLTFSALVKDAGGHTRPGLEINWTSPCASIATTPAVSTSVTFPVTSGGTACSVTAAYGTLLATVTIEVQHQGPFALAVEQIPTNDGAASQGFAATVTDAHGHSITNASIVWSSSCGALSQTTGYNTSFTPPSDLGGSSCTVTAKLAQGGAAEVSSTVSTPMSLLLPIAIVVPIALAVVVLLLWLKKRPKKPAEAEAPPPPEPIEETKPSFEVDIR